MVSSIALLKLAYEGALTLTRSLGSLVTQRICVAVTVFAASSFFDHKRSSRPYASQASLLHIGLSAALFAMAWRRCGASEFKLRLA
ncbi:hypothetical protein Efla_006327 [Eimeria flavescens]